MTSWDKYFMTLSFVVSLKSKDPSTKVGAVIVGPGHEVFSTGYNGFPRNVIDTDARYADRDYKYDVANHAEENAILNAGRVGVRVQGCTMYVLWKPCIHCARLIVQSGISEVVYYKEFPGTDAAEKHWADSMKKANELFEEASVKVRAYSGALLEMKGLHSQSEWRPVLSGD